MNWRKTSVIARREFSERTARPVFWMTTLLGVILMIALIVGPSVIQKLSHPTVTVGSVGVPRVQLERIYQKIPHRGPLHVKYEPNLGAASRLVKSGHLSGFFAQRGSRTYFYGSPNGTVDALIAGINRVALVQSLGPKVLHTVMTAEAKTAVTVVPMAPTTSFIVRSLSIYALGLVLFMLVLMYGVLIGMSVVEEKETRHAEMLLARITPNALLSGKILGFGALAFLQLAIWAGAALITYLIHGHTAFLHALPLEDICLFALWAIIGYGQYATIFAALASRATRTTEMNQATMPVTLIVLVGYFGSILASTHPVGILATILHAMAFVPFLAPIMAFALLQLGGLPWWQLLLDVSLQLFVWWWVLGYASRLFRRHLLDYQFHPKRASLWNKSEAKTRVRRDPPASSP